MDIYISIVIVDYNDSSSCSICLVQLIFRRIIFLGHDAGSSSSSSMSTLSLISIGGHLLKLPVLIKLLLVRHVSSVPSLDSVYHCRSSLAHSHLFLGLLDEIIVLGSGIHTFDSL